MHCNAFSAVNEPPHLEFSLPLSFRISSEACPGSASCLGVSWSKSSSFSELKPWMMWVFQCIPIPSQWVQAPQLGVLALNQFPHKPSYVGNSQPSSLARSTIPIPISEPAGYSEWILFVRQLNRLPIPFLYRKILIQKSSCSDLTSICGQDQTEAKFLVGRSNTFNNCVFPGW